METETTQKSTKPSERAPVTEKGSWLLEAQKAIRERGRKPFEFTPITIKGEPLSETIIRERRGDFDSPLS